MSDASASEPQAAPPRRRAGLSPARWATRLVASRGFQRWASRFPLTRGTARREGEALMDLVAGFVHSQVLMALVELELLEALADRPLSPEEAGARTGVAPARMAVLLQAGAALGLMKRKRNGRYALARRGAALLGVPGLAEMIRHHRVLYRDLADPVAFLRGEGETELARFWPYVFGEGREVDPEAAERYSALMAESQVLVAEETLRAVSLKGVERLMDVGGGTGAFLAAAAKAWPEMKGTLVDLPAVAPAARARFERAGLADRLRIVPGNFREEPLPPGADAVSLVRVLYDHSDDTVRLLLRRVAQAIAPGGRLIISEPMSGGARPERAGDAYFALYTLAMGTGKTRSAEEIGALLAEAGFTDIRAPRVQRPFVTSVVSCVRRG